MFKQLRQRFSELYPSRVEFFDIAMACQVTRRANVLLIGPPGVGKSEMVRVITKMSGGTMFEKQLSRWTRVEDLFGPVDIKGLMEGTYRFKWKGFLPDADVVFLDEFTRAEGPILDTVLAAMNEKLVRLGEEIVPIRARLFIGTANFLPQDRRRYQAVMDRFHFKFLLEVDQSMSEIFVKDWLEMVSDVPSLPEGFMDEAHTKYKEVEVGEEWLEFMEELKNRLIGEGIYVSPRRLSRAMEAAAALAWLEGDKEVQRGHIRRVFPNAIWEDQKEIGVARSIFLDALKVGYDAVIQSAKKIEQLMEELDQATHFSGVVQSLKDELENFDDLVREAGIARDELVDFVNLGKVDEAREIVENA